MSEDDSGTVIEKRSVDEITEDTEDVDEANEKLDETVDEMLDTSDLEHGNEDDTSDGPRPEIQEVMDEAEERQKAGTEVTVSSDTTVEDAADEYESFDFEDQEWTLDERREVEVRNIRGMKFKFKEPEDDDEVLNTLEAASDGGRGDQMYSLVRLVVAAPTVTKERWEGMSISAKLTLSSQAAEYLGLDEGFLEE